MLGALILTAINLACTIIVQAIFRAGRKANKQMKRDLMKTTGAASEGKTAGGETTSHPFLFRPSQITSFVRQYNKKGRKGSKQVKSQVANEAPMPLIPEASNTVAAVEAERDTTKLTDVAVTVPNNESKETQSTKVPASPADSSSGHTATSDKISVPPTVDKAGLKIGSLVFGNLKYPLVYCLKLAWILNIVQSIIYIGGHIMISCLFLFPILFDND